MDFQTLIRNELDALTPYAPGLRASEVKEKTGASRIVKLSSNELSTGPVPEAVRAIEAMAVYSNRYPDGSARALRGRIARWLEVPRDNVVVGAGSNELIRLIAQAVLRPGDECVFAWPSFVVYPIVTQMFGATAVRIPLKADDTHDLEAMADAITERTRLVFLCNPNNPTGTIYHRIAFERFLGRLPEHVLLVVDEAYFEFVADEHYPDALRYFDSTPALCVMRTFSKIYSLASLRIGYGVVPEPIRHAIERLREPFNTSALAQAAAYYSIPEHEEIERRRAENIESRERMCSAFDQIGLEYAASHANFVYVKTDEPQRLFEALLAEGVIVRDFGASPALRVTVGDPEETGFAIAAFERTYTRLYG